jgi:uncharacterized membrane protein AbrB (regulator of aidB expression)
MTLSLMALELSTTAVSNREAASIISIFIIVFTVAGALLVRSLGRRFGIQHGIQATAPGLAGSAQPAVALARASSSNPIRNV